MWVFSKYPMKFFLVSLRDIELMLLPGSTCGVVVMQSLVSGGCSAPSGYLFCVEQLALDSIGLTKILIEG